MEDRLKDFELVYDKQGYPDMNVEKGDTVLDDLTDEICEVLRLEPKEGMDAWQGNAVILDSDYLDGWRHPWEVTKLRRKVNEDR